METDKCNTSQPGKSTARTKLFIQLLDVKSSNNMTRAYLAMKQSNLINPKNNSK